MNTRSYSVYLYGALSSDNFVSENFIVDNSVEIIMDSESNIFFHNAFPDNGAHARVWGERANRWDFRDEGNLWGNYTGDDDYHEDQNEPGSDGIGDTPHVINETEAGHSNS